jgi:large subunit ribosomal protein L24
MKVKKGDQVTVIAGNDKGKTGRVLQVLREKDRVIVEGVKFVKRHTRPTSAGKGGIVEKEAAIHISNVKKVG